MLFSSCVSHLIWFLLFSLRLKLFPIQSFDTVAAVFDISLMFAISWAPNEKSLMFHLNGFPYYVLKYYREFSGIFCYHINIQLFWRMVKITQPCLPLEAMKNKFTDMNTSLEWMKLMTYSRQTKYCALITFNTIPLKDISLSTFQ